ncbi:MAG: fibronectin type III domain-containing protein, partial [Deltaproteobacteria bacterium]|nr:fibronectin type III domain-containing protein [Deltaproteobacteria bacterium]
MRPKLRETVVEIGKKDYILFGLVLSLAFILSLGACGKRGAPMPPSLVVAEKISDLKLEVKPGERNLVWSIPRKNADNSKPVDLSAFQLKLKKVPKDLDSCRYCDEGFFDYLTINLLKPESGFHLGTSFYLPVPEIEKDFIYVFSVTSLNSRGWSSEVSNKLALFALPEVAPPVKVELIPSASIVELSWQAPILADDFTGALRYRVYRRQPELSGSDWRLITPEPITEAYFVDVGLVDWQAYEYTVTAIALIEKTSFESDYSAIAQVIPGDYTAPESLGEFSVFNYEAGIQLIWNPSAASDLAGYNVYRR